MLNIITIQVYMYIVYSSSTILHAVYSLITCSKLIFIINNRLAHVFTNYEPVLCWI